MITTKPIIIQNIMTTDILYYDSEFKNQCYEFCVKRNIDCLPSIIKPDQFYLRQDKFKNFKRQTISEYRVIAQSEYIFNPILSNRFEKQNILFVYDKNRLTGIVHFSDYNKGNVRVYLYSLLNEYERLLRKLLIVNYLRNDDMINYFKSLKDKHYEERLEGISLSKYDLSDFPDFEKFYFLELIQLLLYHKIIKLNQEVNKLRNSIMHAHELVHKKDNSVEDLIFSLDSFKIFFCLVGILLKDFKKVSNRLLFISNSI